MKCVKCGNPTKGNKIICPNCINTDVASNYLRTHVCGSFTQVKGADEGICQHVFECMPIKLALKNEILFEKGIGHVICPHAGMNLGVITHKDFADKELDFLKMNYKECFE